jgi:hypothetical protein
MVVRIFVRAILLSSIIDGSDSTTGCYFNDRNVIVVFRFQKIHRIKHEYFCTTAMAASDASRTVGLDFPINV